MGGLIKDELGDFFGDDAAGMHLLAGVDRGSFVHPGNQSSSEDSAGSVEIGVHDELSIGTVVTALLRLDESRSRDRFRLRRVRFSGLPVPILLLTLFLFFFFPIPQCRSPSSRRLFF